MVVGKFANGGNRLGFTAYYRFTQIASASEEQTAVAEEVNRSMTHISQAADVVADDSKRAAQTSRSLTDLGNRLGRLVGQFRI